MDYLKQIKLFFAGFFYIGLLAINTYFIAKEKFIIVFFVSIVIGLIWTYNVKNAAFSSLFERFVYSVGAATGSIVGIYLSKLLL